MVAYRSFSCSHEDEDLLFNTLKPIIEGIHESIIDGDLKAPNFEWNEMFYIWTIQFQNKLYAISSIRSFLVGSINRAKNVPTTTTEGAPTRL